MTDEKVPTAAEVAQEMLDDGVAGMREGAATMRQMSGECQATHAELARMLATETDPKRRKVAETMATITDCMARRFRQWADVTESAANELDAS